ncbi:MAG: hypothetical protein QOJ72_840 [Nocardioidaceae bacterium]|nr:hypothetical protein [Nocardioidaceae bacterium]
MISRTIPGLAEGVLDGCRVVLAEDMVLLRAGVSRLLREAGCEVVGEVDNAVSLLEVVRSLSPDLALIDIKMPPTHTEEGLVAASEIRSAHPDTAVLLLSSYLDARYAGELIAQHPARCGYLLKDTMADSDMLVDAIRRVLDGECVVDAAIVARLLARQRSGDPISDLTAREKEILGLMAEGHSNRAICGLLFLSPRTVETHVRNVFTKLGLSESADTSRRVQAVLTYLRD